MKNIPLLLGTIFGSIVLIFGIGFLFSRTPATTTKTVDRNILETDLVHTKGATQSAKVVVVEFSDFQCPACRASVPLLAQLEQEYAGQVKFAFRFFPLEQIHDNALPAALAAQAASRQNAFWPYHDLLFEKQEEWSVIKDKDQLQGQLIAYADSLKLNKDQFVTDLNSPDIAQQATTDTALANQLKVDSTPTFFVNGVPTTSAKLKETIDAQLASAQ